MTNPGRRLPGSWFKGVHVNKQQKIAHKGASRSLRRFLTQMNRENTRFKMEHTIKKPTYIYRTDGSHGVYDGP